MFAECNGIKTKSCFLQQSLKLTFLYNKTFICNSGAEAIEGALKLAFKSFNGKRKYVLHSDISYHVD